MTTVVLIGHIDQGSLSATLILLLSGLFVFAASFLSQLLPGANGRFGMGYRRCMLLETLVTDTSL